jgi:polysaccharide biosynthesis/export protein
MHPSSREPAAFGASAVVRPPRQRAAGAWLLGLLLLAAGGWAQGGDGYRIGPKDLLELRVYEAPDFNVELRVAEDGTVRLPVFGDLLVAGLTADEATVRIDQTLEQCCVQRATVTLALKEVRFRPVSVIGAVGRPGPQSVTGRWTLLEVLSAAGGVAPQHGDVVHVIRRSESGLADQLTIRLDDLLLKGDARVNIPIYPGDLINVPATVDLTVFCLGQVQRPGPVVFKSTERISLLTAIARAGGLTDRASRKIEIKRQGEGGVVGQLEFDYRAVLAGKVPDPELHEGDILMVKESFF